MNKRLHGILLPVAQMANADWNILDATGRRVAIAGSLEGGKWETNPDLAKALVELINGASEPDISDEAIAETYANLLAHKMLADEQKGIKQADQYYLRDAIRRSLKAARRFANSDVSVNTSQPT